MESIQSNVGFYGWKCESYFKYILGLCPFDDNEMTIAGENCSDTSRGMFFVKTNTKFPFAKGRKNDDEHSDATRDRRENIERKSLEKVYQAHLKDMLGDSKDFEDILYFNRFSPKVTLVNKYLLPSN